MGSVGSVQGQIVPCSSLYLFPRSIGAPPICSLSINCQVLVRCTYQFQSGSSFVYFGFLCLQGSLVSDFCPDTGVKGGYLLRLTGSVVLWGGRDTANKYCWPVWGVLMVDGPHWVCHSPRWHVLPGSTLLRLQGALQGRCPKWALHFVHFPGLSCSGSWFLHGSTDPGGLCVLCPSKVPAAYARPGAW